MSGLRLSDLNKETTYLLTYLHARLDEEADKAVGKSSFARRTLATPTCSRETCSRQQQGAGYHRGN